MEIKFNDKLYQVGNITTPDSAAITGSSEVSAGTKDLEIGRNLELLISKDSSPREIELITRLDNKVSSLTLNTCNIKDTASIIEQVIRECSDDLTLCLKLDWEDIPHIPMAISDIDEVEIYLPAEGITDKVIQALDTLPKCKLLKVNALASLETCQTILDKEKVIRLLEAGVKQVNFREIVLHDEITMRKYGERNDLYDYKGSLYPVFSRQVLDKVAAELGKNHPELMVDIETSEKKSLRNLAKFITGLGRYS